MHVEALFPSSCLSHSCPFYLVVCDHGAASQYNDTHVLDTTTLEWARLTSGGSIPAPRYEMALALVNLRGRDTSGVPMLVVFGGASATGNFNDVYSCNLHTGTWTRRHGGDVTPHADDVTALGGDVILSASHAPSPRTLHHAPVVESPGCSHLYVFGGGHAGATPVADTAMHALHLVGSRM